MNFKKFILLILLPTLAIGGNTGKIAGRVTDAQTGEPIIGANVIIEGTYLGAATDMNGNYVIINVPPGVYKVKASAVGYKTVIKENVKVSIDLTTTVNFQLEPTVIEIGEEVVVVAERPLVQKDLTASTAIIGSELIQALPITEFQEVIELQAGVVAGHIRGGRSGEVAYWIDGVPVTDVYDRSTVIDVDRKSIQELQLVSGAFNAEYGQAMSGIINIATKDGDNKFNGSFTSYFGGYATNHTNIFTGLNRFDVLSIRNFEGNLSGPILKDKIFFYLNARWIYFGGWLYGVRKFKPENIIDNRDPDPNKWIISINPEQGLGDSAITPMNWNRKIFLQGKFTFQILPTLKISYNYMNEFMKYRDFDFAFKYNPDGDLNRFRKGITNIFMINHTLSNSTFYQASFSYFFKDYRHYVFEDPHDSRYVHPKLLLQPGPYSFIAGGMKMDHFYRNTGTYVGKIDLTSQITKVHQVKTGVEFRYHTIYFEGFYLDLSDEDRARDPILDWNPYVKTRIPDISEPSHTLFRNHPKEFSAYIQDKMEFNEIILNVGVRFDWFDPDWHVLADPSDPNIYQPLKPQNRFFDTNKNGIYGDEGDIPKTVDDRRAYWYIKAKPKRQFSPRIGIAFPITDRGVIHFSYGHFFQIPPFEYLYTNPEFKLGSGTGNIGLVGNADLKPEQTVSGEIGVQQAITNDIAIELTGYFRDIRNLTGTRADEIFIFGGSAWYNQYQNTDFGFVRGIVFSFDKRFSNNWALTIDYTFQVAKGNASDPAQTRNLRLGGQWPEIKIISLDWDQRHTLNITASYSVPGDWGLSVVMQYGSGTPYTPRQSKNIGTLLINSEKKPSIFNVDLRLYKDIKFKFFTFSLFARIYNLFDIKNAYGVYNDTGRPDFTLDYLSALKQQPVQLVNPLGEWFTNPTFYSEPRRIEFGLTIFFGQ